MVDAFAGGVVTGLVDSVDDAVGRLFNCLEGNSVNAVGRWRTSIVDLPEVTEAQSWSANGTPTVIGAEEPVNHDAIPPFFSSTFVVSSVMPVGICLNSLKPLSWQGL